MHDGLGNSVPSYLPVTAVLVGLLLVLGVGHLNSAISGWKKLSRRFMAQTEPYGDSTAIGPWLLTVSMRFWAHYSSLVRITAGQDALYLSMSWWMGSGHPPLRIPWSEISFSRTRRFFARYVVLTLGNEEKIPFRISELSARKLGVLDRNLGRYG